MMSKAKVKLLSWWHGPLPRWMDRFVAQMSRFREVDWELVMAPSTCVGQRAQVRWLNSLATSRLGTPCRKGLGDAVCDYRPTYALLFKERYEGYGWWGWCDLDLMFGDVDRLLPPLLGDGVDAVTFKRGHLSGCLTILRNVPLTTHAYLGAPWRFILADERYHVWDESGNDWLNDLNFQGVLEANGARMSCHDELYSYDTVRESIKLEVRDGALFAPGLNGSGTREVLFCHFMSNVWPGVGSA